MKQRFFVHGNPCFVKLVLVSILLVSLAGCSGGGDNGNGGNGGHADANLYQQALSDYQTGNYSRALNEFQDLVARYPASIYVDNAEYYTARCQHELHDFDSARTLYSAFLTNYANSNYADNAVFYNGKSYYDEAQLQTDAPTEFNLLQSAITHLPEYENSYPAGSLLDAMQYYLGRSYHDQAKLVLADQTLSTSTATQLFSQARTDYDLVTVNSGSIYADNAQYFKAQSYHDEADFTNARVEYDVLITANVSNWADDAKYQYAKTYYDEALVQPDPATALAIFDTAIIYFDEMLDSTNPLYQSSNRLDSAYYFKGRSLQRQGDLIAAGATADMAAKYAAARTAFQAFLSAMPQSTWADNAWYQIGTTYYDEASVADGNADYTTMRDKLSNAIAEFTALLNSALYARSSSADNAQYYLGRSYQMILTMPDIERTTANGLDFSTISYETARSAFYTLINNFPQSAWVDNAYYEIGNTYYAEAPGAADTVSAYNNALGAYNQVISTYAGNSIREDNSAYNMGMIYHDTGYCEAEKAALDYTLTIVNISITIRDDINNNHMPDLTTALATQPPTPTGAHTCDPTNFPEVDTTYFNGASNTASLEQRLFTGGVNLYETAQYALAIDQFNTQLASFPQGEFADDAHLYIGRSNYYLAGAAVAPQDAGYYTAAENEFTLILTDFSGGDVVDGAHYWLGKTYDITNRFTLARSEYALVPQGSGWYDSALYSIGKTYYDESKTAATPTAVLSLLQESEQHLNTALQSMSAGSLSRDDTVYFLARTYHEMGDLLAANPTLSAPLTVAEYLALARNNYDAVVSVSNYADDAAYQIGKTYYDEADLLAPVDAMAAYGQAVAQFDIFLNNPNFTASSRRDNVYYFQGRSLYKQAHLVKANPQLVAPPSDADTYFARSRTSFSALLAMTPASPTWHDNAQYYLARSYHEQLLPDYTSARDAYQVLVGDATSPYADDAKYQIGKSYFDEAQGLADPALAITAYSNAILHFDAFILDPVDPIYQYPASNRAEEARYYKGRSLHEHAMLVNKNPANPNVSGDTAVLFTDARIAYESVIALDALAAYADNAKYYIGKSHYDEANALTNPADQMNGFEQAAVTLEAFMPLTGFYSASSYAHEGLYFLGRARQQQGELLLKDPALIIADDAAATFTKSRTAFQDCIAADSTGIYADNAQYQIGATYYDEANDLAKSAVANPATADIDYAGCQGKLNNAINTFQSGFLGQGAIYSSSSYADNAQYYLGRSYHVAADIPANYRVDLSANTGGINFIAVTYADARAGYLPLITDVKYAGSAWIDNAYYEIGNTYYTEAEAAIDNLIKEAAFNNALQYYHIVVTGYPAGIRLDNAVFQIAWIYHLGEYCALEVDWFNFHATLSNVSASDATVRDSHLADLLLATPNSHLCPVPPVLSLTNFAPPQNLP
ncbi:outer membrane protein assembly factor BamD [Kaarinaea lacus]